MSLTCPPRPLERVIYSHAVYLDVLTALPCSARSFAVTYGAFYVQSVMTTFSHPCLALANDLYKA